MKMNVINYLLLLVHWLTIKLLNYESNDDASENRLTN